MRTRYIRVKDKPSNLDKFPNFCKSGSIKGMKEKFYGADALLVMCGGYIYNVTSEPSIYYGIAY